MTETLSRRSLLALSGAAVLAGCAGRSTTTGTPLLESAVWGAYASPEPYPDDRPHLALERELGARLPVMSWFQNWDAGWPRAAADAGPRGYQLLIAWEPILNGRRPVPFADILAGRWDRYLETYLAAAGRYPQPVTLRFAHEMNLGKFAWSVGRGGPDSAEQFVAAWRRVHAIWKAAGTRNVQLMWCIAAADGPVAAERYYPGGTYVHKLGFDAYNGFGTGWAAPYETFRPSMERLHRLSPAKPMWVAETGCREARAGETHSKAQWLEQLFAETRLSRLSHVVFFHADKERDWRLTSSPATTRAARRLATRRTTPTARRTGGPS